MARLRYVQMLATWNCSVLVISEAEWKLRDRGIRASKDWFSPSKNKRTIFQRISWGSIAATADIKRQQSSKMTGESQSTGVRYQAKEVG